MKQPMINYMKSIKNDELYTPTKGILPLLKYLPKDLVYWECTDFGDSNITEVLKNNGYKTVTTHLNTGFDFLKDEPDFDFDCIITNPPFSKKDKFLERAYKIGKPFCFLLPITALEGKRRGRLFRKYGIQVLVLDSRIDFTGKGNNWFNVSWFCWKVLPEKLIFESI